MPGRIGIVAALAGAALVICSAGSAGSAGGAFSVVLQPDGKIVAVGWGELGAQRTFGLARYQLNGEMDASFGLGGKVVDPHPYELTTSALQPDGKIVAAGSGASDFQVARYMESGRLDATFGGGGHFSGSFYPDGSVARGVAVQPDGKIAVVGDETDTAPPGELWTIRLTRAGRNDSTFGSHGSVVTGVGAYGSAAGLALQPDGKIVVAGTDGDNHRFALIRYLPDGSRDPSFGSSGIVWTPLGRPAEAHAVALQPDGRIVVAGSVKTDAVGPGYKFALARYNSDGSLDSSFGSDGVVTTSIGNVIAADLPFGGVAYALALQPDGKIVAGGAQLVPYPGRGNFALARYLPDGSLDSSFGVGGKVTTSFGYAPPENPTEDGDVIDGLAVQPDGKIVAAGYSQFGPHTEQYAVALARYLPDGSLDPAFGQGGQVKTSLALCRVPKLGGQKMDWFAQQWIKGAHCAVGKIKCVYSHLKRRRIISERPRPGTVRVEGTRVRLLVSLGRR